MTETLPTIENMSRSNCSRSSGIYSVGRSFIDSRNALSRSSSVTSGQSSDGGDRREWPTSLSALYRSAYKPYQFTHMYGTKYNRDFQGRFLPPPLPERQSSARFAPMKYVSLKTTYQQEFQDKEPLGRSLVVPLSRHRKHRPHPNLTNTWQYPNSSRWIWSVPNSDRTELTTVSEEQNDHRKTRSAGFSKGKSENIRTHRWCSR